MIDIADVPLAAKPTTTQERVFHVVRRCSHSDLPHVIRIFRACFKDNHAIKWLLKSGGENNDELDALATYAFYRCLRHGRAYMDANQTAVALLCQPAKETFSLRNLQDQLRFTFRALSIRKLYRVLKREAHRKRIRSIHGDYIYFWFLAASQDSKNAGFALKNRAVEFSKSLNLPLCLETSSERHAKVYERLGFRVYHIWKDTSRDIQFWFLVMYP